MNRQQQKQLHEPQKKTANKRELIYVPADTGNFKELIPGASMRVVWGNDQTGPFGAITRFVPGFDAGMHTHTSDVRIVVIKGAYIYKDGKGEKRVGPGDFLFIPGGTKHWTGSDPKEGALFYDEGDGRFDIVPVM